jgi:soluble lytic murein transglycosylase-like protein
VVANAKAFFIITGIWLAGLFFLPPAFAKNIFLTYRDGVACFTDYPLSSESKVVAHGEKSDFKTSGSNSYLEMIQEVSRKEGVDPGFIAAVVKAESNFNPNAVSQKGAMGLMQLMPHLAKKYSLTNPFDTKENLATGVKVLKNLLGYYNGDKKLALAAYNAGHNAVKKYSGVPPYPETKNYINTVLKHYQNYQQDKNISFTAPAAETTTRRPSPSKIYKIVDQNGSILFTNLPRRI